MTETPKKKTAPKAKRASRPRDPEATMKLIIDSTLQLLCEKGFTGIGVNAIAAAAGVDKQLIYYYFGGLDGVIRKLGEQQQRWLGAPLEARQGEPYAQASNRLMMEYIGALRTNPLVQRLLVWEMAEPSALLSELEHSRSAAMVGWVGALRRAAAPPPPEADAPAINAILLAGLQYLAMREHATGSFAGLEFRSPEGQARVARALEFITSRVYADPASPAGPSLPAS